MNQIQLFLLYGVLFGILYWMLFQMRINRDFHNRLNLHNEIMKKMNNHMLLRREMAKQWLSENGDELHSLIREKQRTKGEEE